MSFNHNHFSIVGRLVRDPEISYTHSNKAMAKFSLACNAGKDGQGQDRADFFDCTAWEKTAELIQQYVFKGSKILAEGRMAQEKWTDKETGKARSKITLTVRNVEFLDTRQAQEGAPADQMPGGYSRPAAPPQGAPARQGYDSNPAGRPGGAPMNREAARRPAPAPRSRGDEDAEFERSFEENPPQNFDQAPPDEETPF